MCCDVQHSDFAVLCVTLFLQRCLVTSAKIWSCGTSKSRHTPLFAHVCLPKALSSIMEKELWEHERQLNAHIMCSLWSSSASRLLLLSGYTYMYVLPVGRLKGHYQGLVPCIVMSMPSTLMHGWLVLVRVIDGPVYQDVLTWDDYSQSSLKGIGVIQFILMLSKSSTIHLWCVLAM